MLSSSSETLSLDYPSIDSQPTFWRSKKTPPFLVYCCAFFAIGLVLASLGPAFPMLRNQTDSNTSTLSGIFTSRAIGYLTGSMFGGPLFDRFNGNVIIAVSLSLTCLSTILVPFMPSVVILGVTTFFQGLSMGTLDTGGNVMLIWLYGEDVGPYMQGLHFAFGIGAAISAPLIAASIALFSSIKAAFILFGIMSIFTVVFILRLTKPEIKKDEEGKTSGVPAHDIGVIALTAGILFFYVGTEVAAGGLFTSYGEAMGILDEFTSVFLSAGFWGLIAVGRGIAVPLSLKLTTKTILFIDLIGSLIGVLVIYAFSTSAFALWTGIIIFGLSMASIFPTAVSLAEEYVFVSGKIAAMFVVGASLGEMLIPLLAGILFDAVSPLSLLPTLGVSMIFCTVCFALEIFFGRSKHQTISNEIMNMEFTLD